MIIRDDIPDEYKRAFKYFKLQLEHAQEVGDHGLVQLAYHTLAQNYAAEAPNFGIESINVTKVTCQQIPLNTRYSGTNPRQKLSQLFKQVSRHN